MTDGLRWEALCEAGIVDLETGILQDLESAPIYVRFLRGEISVVEILPLIEALEESRRPYAATNLDLDQLDLMYLEAQLAVPAIEEFLARHRWTH
jgi:hypothetical protein